MGKALYRQYRSTNFDEVIGQEHITSTLKNSLKNETIAHAYLLTGPRGVGKTSIARILAHAVNDLPYKNDSLHLDIIEIDAASNRRIDEIRSLRDKVHIAPTSARYKVYIIDEVHMLTREAFNALLKTLEEPPAHVIFILATTEINKLPDTIVSRCITFTFRPIEVNDLVRHLKHIAQTENITITDDALELLAEHGDGSFRDSITLLDQVKNLASDAIKKTDIERILGIAPEETIKHIISAILQGDAQGLNKALIDTYVHGVSDMHLTKQVASSIRTELMAPNPRINSDHAIHLLQKLVDVPGSPKPRAALELALLETLFALHPIQSVASVKQGNTQPAVQTPQEPDTPKAIPQPNPPEPEQSQVDLQPSSTKEAPVQPEKPATIEPSELWETVLDELKKNNNTLYGIARMAQADHTNGTLHLYFKFAFHFKQVSQPRNKSILTGILDTHGKGIELKMSLVKTDNAPKMAKKDELSSITDIFGAGEVLES